MLKAIRISAENLINPLKYAEKMPKYGIIGQHGFRRSRNDSGFILDMLMKFTAKTPINGIISQHGFIRAWRGIKFKVRGR